jgi:phage tail sheath protein FI
MPVAPTFPGVYIEEIPRGVRTIVGVATNIAALLGRAISGPANKPTTINSFADFERQFGGLGIDYPMSYAVNVFTTSQLPEARSADPRTYISHWRPERSAALSGLARLIQGDFC